MLIMNSLNKKNVEHDLRILSHNFLRGILLEMTARSSVGYMPHSKVFIDGVLFDIGRTRILQRDERKYMA